MERGQTVVRAQRGSDRIIDSVILAERFWESQAGEGESPVHESNRKQQDPEYHETRETLWEVGGTTLQG